MIDLMDERWPSRTCCITTGEENREDRIIVIENFEIKSFVSDFIRTLRSNATAKEHLPKYLIKIPNSEWRRR